MICYFPILFIYPEKPDGLWCKVSLSNACNVCDYCMLSSQMQTLQRRNTRFIYKQTKRKQKSLLQILHTSCSNSKMLIVDLKVSIAMALFFFSPWLKLVSKFSLLSDNNTKRLTTDCPWCIARKREKKPYRNNKYLLTWGQCGNIRSVL